MMNQDSKSRLAKISIILFGLGLSLILNSCGQSFQALDDQKAPFVNQNNIRSDLVPTVPTQEPLPPPTMGTSQAPQFLQLPDHTYRQEKAVRILNASTDTDFKTKEMLVKIEIAGVSSDKVVSIELKGVLQDSGFFHLKENSSSPRVKGLARCIELCEAVVIDLYFRKSNGKIEHHQLMSRVKSNSSNSDTNDDTKISPPNMNNENQADSEHKDQQNTENLIEDYDTEEKPGMYVQIPVDENFFDDLVTVNVPTNTTKAEEPTNLNPSPQPNNNNDSNNTNNTSGTGSSNPSSSNPSPVTPTTPATPQPREEQDQVLYKNSRTYSQVCNELFPCPLPPPYTGLARNYYSALYYDNTENKIVVQRQKDAPSSRYSVHALGAIANSTALAPSGIGFIFSQHYRTTNGPYYGSGYLIKYLEEAFQRVARQYPGTKFTVTQLSKQRGGPYRPHASHQNGLDADVPILKSTNGTLLSQNWHLMKTLYDLGGLHRVGTDRANRHLLCVFAKSINEYEKYKELFRIIQHWDGHQTHYHIRLKCTPHNPSCRPDLSVPSTNPDC